VPKLPRLTAAEVGALLLRSGFMWVRSKGSHRIYQKGSRRIVIPFHSGALHPKIVKQTLEAIEETSGGPSMPK
jgi:predicted RNA binding protein YcfA (HicA-like mRNA interferase family)